jgi:hypothetical protein
MVMIIGPTSYDGIELHDEVACGGSFIVLNDPSDFAQMGLYGFLRRFDE